jgi:nucleoid-associated protein YgaU
LGPEGLPQQYAVQEGEDLWKISEKFYTSGYNWVDIAEANELANPNLIEVGQELTLPKVAVKEPASVKIEGEMAEGSITDETYQVQRGDSLWKIALRAYGDGYQWVKIASANGLDNPNLIHPGNALTIPR